MHRVRTAQPLYHAHHDGEEAEIGGNQRLWHQPRKPDRIQHHDNHRRNGKDRDRLAGDDPRHQRLVHRPVFDNRDRQPDPQNGAHQKAKHCRGQCDPAMKDEGPFGGDFLFDCCLPDFSHDLVRCRQDRAVMRHCIAHKVAHLPFNTGLFILVDLPWRIQINGKAVPYDHDGGDHRGNGKHP